MPTAAERQALLFIVAVALVGGGVRAFEAHRLSQPAPPSPPGDVAENVESQLAAVDSERAHTMSRDRRPKSGANTHRFSSRSFSQRRADTSMNARDRSQRARRPDKVAVAIDVDAASAEDLERLPHIGAALAQRIVANRDSLGTFGSIEALTRVRGIGAALAKQLAPMVTFSGGPSPVHGELRKRFH